MSIDDIKKQFILGATDEIARISDYGELLDIIKNYLDQGDYIKIARIVGYENLTQGRKYVYKVLSKRIKGNRGKAKEIIEAAIVIANRNIGNGKSHEENNL